jgi:chemotaxis protein CheZ
LQAEPREGDHRMDDNIAEDNLKAQLSGLLLYIQRVRQEIAAISNPSDEEHHFNSMGDQLDAIVSATEKATNTIMAAMERNDGLIDELRKNLKDAGNKKILDKIAKNGADVFEACSFQDITGQRVNKVVKSVTYVEERVTSLVELWGKEELDKIEVEIAEKTEDEKLLAGPQMEGKGLSQAEVDALFD